MCEIPIWFVSPGRLRYRPSCRSVSPTLGGGGVLTSIGQCDSLPRLAIRLSWMSLACAAERRPAGRETAAFRIEPLSNNNLTDSNLKTP